MGGCGDADAGVGDGRVCGGADRACCSAETGDPAETEAGDRRLHACGHGATRVIALLRNPATPVAQITTVTRRFGTAAVKRWAPVKSVRRGPRLGETTTVYLVWRGPCQVARRRWPVRLKTSLVGVAGLRMSGPTIFRFACSAMGPEGVLVTTRIVRARAQLAAGAKENEPFAPRCVERCRYRPAPLS